MSELIPEDQLQLEKMKTRFLTFVNKTDNCWTWIGTKDARGYGRFAIKFKKYMAHRISYELFKGEIPNKLVIDHLCNNKPCVNPSHLEAITHKANTLRAGSPIAVNARKTHCVRGHPFNNQNTYPQVGKRGRGCIQCRFENYRKRYLSNYSKFREHDKQYYQLNKERIKARQKAYYWKQKNKQ